MTAREPHPAPCSWCGVYHDNLCGRVDVERVDFWRRFTALPGQQKITMPITMPPLGWWVISGESLLDLLRRAHDGEDPDLLYAEEYANGEHERHEGAP